MIQMRPSLAQQRTNQINQSKQSSPSRCRTTATITRAKSSKIGDRDLIDHKNKMSTASSAKLGEQLPQMLTKCVYLDYNATTPIFPEVVSEMVR